MLMMRLQRVGRRNDPSYRIVVTDKRTGPKSNKNVDILGSYNPKMDHVQVDGDRAKDWIGKGVQLSDTVHNILVSQKIIEGKKVNVLPKKSPIVNEAEESTPETSEGVEETTDAEPTEEKDAPAEETKEDEPAAEEETKEEKPEDRATEEKEEVSEPKEEGDIKDSEEDKKD